MWLSPAQPGLMSVLRRGTHPSCVTCGTQGAAKNAQRPHHPVAHRHGGLEDVSAPQACLGEVFCTHSSAGLSFAWLEGLCVWGCLWWSVWLWPGVMCESLSALRSPVPALEPSLLPCLKGALGHLGSDLPCLLPPVPSCVQAGSACLVFQS